MLNCYWQWTACRQIESDEMKLRQEINYAIRNINGIRCSILFFQVNEKYNVLKCFSSLTIFCDDTFAIFCCFLSSICLSSCRTGLFIPDMAFEAIVKQQISRLKGPCMKLVDMVTEEVITNLNQCINTVWMCVSHVCLYFGVSKPAFKT